METKTVLVEYLCRGSICPGYETRWAQEAFHQDNLKSPTPASPTLQTQMAEVKRQNQPALITQMKAERTLYFKNPQALIGNYTDGH